MNIFHCAYPIRRVPILRLFIQSKNSKCSLTPITQTTPEYSSCHHQSDRPALLPDLSDLSLSIFACRVYLWMLPLRISTLSKSTALMKLREMQSHTKRECSSMWRPSQPLQRIGLLETRDTHAANRPPSSTRRGCWGMIVTFGYRSLCMS